MDYVERRLPGSAARAINKIWHLRGSSPDEFEKIVPLPFVHLIVNLSDPYVVVRRGPKTVHETSPDAFVSGLQSTFLVNRNPSELHHVGVEFTPFGMSRYSTFAAADLSDRLVDAETVLPGISPVREQIRATGGAGEALDLLESFLESRARADWAIPRSLERAVDLIAADPQQRISAVATALGITHKTLIGQFHRHCGCTPKGFADVYRHLAFLERIRTAPKDLTWVDLVSETNYFDQAHFIRVFTRFTGMTPSQYLKYRAETGDDDPSFIALGQFG